MATRAITLRKQQASTQLPTARSASVPGLLASSVQHSHTACTSGYAALSKQVAALESKLHEFRIQLKEIVNG